MKKIFLLNKTFQLSGKQKSKSGIDVLTLGGDDYEADPFSSKWVQSVSTN
jgi:hypothetical protein